MHHIIILLGIFIGSFVIWWAALHLLATLGGIADPEGMSFIDFITLFALAILTTFVVSHLV